MFHVNPLSNDIIKIKFILSLRFVCKLVPYDVFFGRLLVSRKWFILQNVVCVSDCLCYSSHEIMQKTKLWLFSY